jgi:hypothetical protein
MKKLIVFIAAAAGIAWAVSRPKTTPSADPWAKATDPV